MKFLFFILFTIPCFAQYPSISSISPNTGINTGGTTITVSGSNLSRVNAAYFGTYSGTIIATSSSGATVISPAVPPTGSVYSFYVSSGIYNSNSVNFYYQLNTQTATSTSTNTATATSTNTATNTPTKTPTPTQTNTQTITGTATNTPTNTVTNTPSPTGTSTYTFTPTPTITPTPSNTPTPIPAFTGTLSFLNLSPTPSPVALTFVAGVLYGVH